MVDKKNTCIFIFVSLVFSVLIALSFFHFYNEMAPVVKGVSPDISIGIPIEKAYESFSAENIAIAKKQNDKVLFSVTANRVIHRKRASRIFIYQNLKEVYLSGVAIDLYTYNKANMIMFEDFGCILTTLGNRAITFDDYASGTVPDSELDILSRIILEDIIIKIHYPGGKTASVESPKATVNFITGNIVFNDRVKLTDATGRILCSKIAVWLKGYKSFYFPDGYSRGGVQYIRKAAYTLREDGRFSRPLRIPKIRYVDFIEKSEEEFYSKIFKKLPPYVRMMFGVL